MAMAKTPDLDQLVSAFEKNGTVDSLKKLLSLMGGHVNMRGIFRPLFQWYKEQGKTFFPYELEYLQSLVEPRMQQSEVNFVVNKQDLSSVPTKTPSEGGLYWPMAIAKDNPSRSSSVERLQIENANIQDQFQKADRIRKGMESENTNLRDQLQEANKTIKQQDSENTNLRDQLQKADRILKDLFIEKTDLMEKLQKTRPIAESFIIRREAVVVKRERIIGQGVFGCVYEGEYYGTPVAVKELKDCCGENWTKFASEAEIGASCHHPNVVRVYGATLEGKSLLVMERLDVNLLEFICKGDMDTLNRHFKCFGLCIAKGLVYLHSKKPPVIHGDLHLGNVLLKQVGADKYEPKIGDLGLAKYASDRQAPKGDVYHYGNILYALSTGRDPKTRTSQLQEIRCPKKRNLVEACTQAHCNKRPFMDQVIDYLNTQFL